MKVYLDNAATTPIAPEVVEAMIPILQNKFGNPSSTHTFGRQVKAELEMSRRKIAKLLNCTPGEIVFTSGGTEADNMAIRCSIHDFNIKHVITTRIEHHAVLHTVEEEAKNGTIQLSYVNLLPNGHIDLSHLEELLANNPKTFVSLMHANNEIGNLLDVKAVGELCEKYDAIFHSDTVQTMGHYAMNLAEMPVHFVTCSAHKFHGPKGIGFLYVNKNLKITPLIHGGAQERNLRGGTENVYGIVGLTKALELALDGVDEHEQHVQGLKTYMIQELRNAIPGVEFNGDAEGKSLYTVLNVALPHNSKGEMFLFNLDIKGIAASGGSACSSGSNKGSHVLQNIAADVTKPNIRFSFSRYTTKEEIDYTVAEVKKLYA